MQFQYDVIYRHCGLNLPPKVNLRHFDMVEFVLNFLSR